MMLKHRYREGQGRGDNDDKTENFSRLILSIITRIWGASSSRQPHEDYLGICTYIALPATVTLDIGTTFFGMSCTFLRMTSHSRFAWPHIFSHLGGKSCGRVTPLDYYLLHLYQFPVSIPTYLHLWYFDRSRWQYRLPYWFSHDMPESPLWYCCDWHRWQRSGHWHVIIQSFLSTHHKSTSSIFIKPIHRIWEEQWRQLNGKSVQVPS